MAAPEQPDLSTQYMTRKEFIENIVLMFKGVLTVPVLRLMAYDTASHLAVPASVVDALLAQPAGAASAPGAKQEAGKTGRKKKGEAAPGEEGKAKRAGKINTYTLFVTWFLDYCSHYGKNPKVQAMKDANPALGKVQLAAHAYQTLSDAEKKELAETYKPLLEAYNAAHMTVPGASKNNEGKLLEELAKFEEGLPHAKTLMKALEFRRKSDWATDPAEMKAEAAHAKQAAKDAAVAAAAGGATPAPKPGATPAPAAAPASVPKAVAPAASSSDEDDEDEDMPAAQAKPQSSDDDSSDESSSEDSSSDDSSSDEEDEAPAARKPAPAPAKPVAAAAAPSGDKKRKQEAAGAAPPASAKKVKEDSKPAATAEKKEKDKKKDKKKGKE